jgi:peroxiredoxin
MNRRFPWRAAWIGLPIALACISPSLAAADLASRAPRFEVRTVTGEKLELDELRRRGPVLIDFWATWCKPCHASMAELEKLYERHRERGLTVIGISVDGPRNFAKVRPFASRLGITYPIVLDTDGSLQRDFHVRAVPTAILVDSSGAVARVQQGYRPGESEALERAIVSLLGTRDVSPTPAGSADSTDVSTPR